MILKFSLIFLSFVLPNPKTILVIGQDLCNIKQLVLAFSISLLTKQAITFKVFTEFFYFIFFGEFFNAERTFRGHKRNTKITWED